MPSISTLDTKSRELLERLDKEIKRYPKTEEGTLRVGEIAKVAGALEILLRYTLQWIGDQEGRTESVQRITGGQLIEKLKTYARLSSAQRSEVKLLCRDANQPGSRLIRFIQVRNETLHGAKAPEPAILIPVLESLRNLIVSYRRGAGWETPEWVTSSKRGSPSSTASARARTGKPSSRPRS